MNTVAKMSALSFAFAALTFVGGRTATAGIACPLYCIDGPAACAFPDGSCDFACNQCICEASGGEWNPGVSCPAGAQSNGDYVVCPMYCIDGVAACVYADGSCDFACNSCLCEAGGGTWNPGVSCP